jgi:hypothetical protein
MFAAQQQMAQLVRDHVPEQNRSLCVVGLGQRLNRLIIHFSDVRAAILKKESLAQSPIGSRRPGYKRLTITEPQSEPVLLSRFIPFQPSRARRPLDVDTGGVKQRLSGIFGRRYVRFRQVSQSADGHVRWPMRIHQERSRRSRDDRASETPPLMMDVVNPEKRAPLAEFT